MLLPKEIQNDVVKTHHFFQKLYKHEDIVQKRWQDTHGKKFNRQTHLSAGPDLHLFSKDMPIFSLTIHNLSPTRRYELPVRCENKECWRMNIEPMSFPKCETYKKRPSKDKSVRRQYYRCKDGKMFVVCDITGPKRMKMQMLNPQNRNVLEETELQM
ncbi:uncharacterized protein LOC118201008 [Stegodyphus dumicola]|uniref:uncharacterized protein LOC118201008 n=1 Tax=Stegodyphus dumicola TaxID=202533 RepID=UPI0015AE3161|nr:uncharacterized protein LOC118201008 [Stegodyphus dumicola]